jgi:hypothetical protein
MVQWTNAYPDSFKGRTIVFPEGYELLGFAAEHDEANGWKLMPPQYGWWLRRRKAQQGK